MTIKHDEVEVAAVVNEIARGTREVQQRIDSLEFSRSRLVQQLERASNSAHREVLMKGLQAIEKELEKILPAVEKGSFIAGREGSKSRGARANKTAEGKNNRVVVSVQLAEFVGDDDAQKRAAPYFAEIAASRKRSSKLTAEISRLKKRTEALINGLS